MEVVVGEITVKGTGLSELVVFGVVLRVVCKVVLIKV